ncbi:MAG TPA: hypothetical protein VLB84_11555 [Bacteroidia bacterium]|nr:hypothetical protein [Bacteroidia bacterium]
MDKDEYIIMANDDINEQQIFLFILAYSGLDKKIIFVNDGWELINFLTDTAISKEKLPKWIILDTDMPKLNGKQTLKLIKEVSIYKGIEIFMYGDDESDETQHFYYITGCRGFINRENLCSKREEIASTLKQIWQNEIQYLITLQKNNRALALRRDNA